VPILVARVTFKRNLFIIKGLKMTLALQVELNHPWQSLFKVHFHTYSGTCEDIILWLKVGYIMNHLVFNGFKGLNYPENERKLWKSNPYRGGGNFHFGIKVESLVGKEHSHNIHEIRARSKD
jgi:hypothetical protein